MLYPIPQQEILALINASNPGSSLTLNDISYEIVSQEVDGTTTVKVIPKAGVAYYGQQVITYRKRQLANSVLGVPVRLLVSTNTTIRELVRLFAEKYGFSFDHASDFTAEQLDKEVNFGESGVQVVEIPSAETSLVWIGSLSITVANGSLDLETIIKDAALNELHYLHQGSPFTSSLAMATYPGDFTTLESDINTLTTTQAVGDTLAEKIRQIMLKQELVINNSQASTSWLGGALKTMTLEKIINDEGKLYAVFKNPNSGGWEGSAFLYHANYVTTVITPPEAGAADLPANNFASAVMVAFSANKPGLNLTASLADGSPAYFSLGNEGALVERTTRGTGYFYDLTIYVAEGAKTEGDTATVVVNNPDGGQTNFVINVTAPTEAPKVNTYELVWDPEGTTSTAANIEVNFGSARGTIDWGDGAKVAYTGGTPQMYYSASKHTGNVVIELEEASIQPEMHIIRGPGLGEIRQWVNHTVIGLNIGGTAINSGAPRLTKVPDAIPASWRVMQYLFSNTTLFDQDLSGWDTTNITSMKGLFYNSKSFTGKGLQNWNTGMVTTMEEMAYQAAVFNTDLSNWDVSNVTNMTRMFYNAKAFNGAMTNWNTASLTSAASMFEGCSVFNQPLNQLNVSKLTTLGSFFRDCAKFNQPLDNWNTAAVTDMSYMFYGCSLFNSSLMGWNTSSVTTMASMFYGAASFNQNIAGWNTGNVTNMSSMWRGDRVFSQDLSSWNVGKVTNHTDYDWGITTTTWPTSMRPRF